MKGKKYIILASAVLLLGVFVYFYVKEENKNTDIISYDDNITTSEVQETSKTSEKFFVDVKGAVKKPGVYEFSDGDKIVDAINTAGGLTKNATTSNINLSKKLTSEMVVYIFTKSELSKSNTTNPITTTTACTCETIEVNNCITDSEVNNSASSNPTDASSTTQSDSASTSDNTKININTASATELTKISGIGDAKAKAIIAYRTEHGLFSKIEDIKNVSGLGDALFEKIKDYITV
jgi:competence protein ComEA